MRRICRAAGWVYLALCVLALGLIPATGAGLLAPNPFVALYAVLLGLPWSLLSAWLTPAGAGVAVNVALIAIGMAVNLAVLRWLCRRGG